MDQAEMYFVVALQSEEEIAINNNNNLYLHIIVI